MHMLDSQLGAQALPPPAAGTPLQPATPNTARGCPLPHAPPFGKKKLRADLCHAVVQAERGWHQVGQGIFTGLGIASTNQTLQGAAGSCKTRQGILFLYPMYVCPYQ
jgi:hypothetical protein